MSANPPSNAPSTDAETNAPDWERIEVDYRAGILSVREIARMHKLSHTYIGNRAKDENWTRDLKAKIRAKAEAEVAKRLVATAVANSVRITERQVIEAGAEAIVQVRLSHRTDIRRGRAVVASLLDELELSCGSENAALLIDLGNLMRAPDKNGRDKRNDLYEKLITTSGRVKTMKDLGDALRTLVTLEREAYGLDDAPGESDPAAARTASLSDAERAIRLTRLLGSNPEALAALTGMQRSPKAAQ